MRVGVSGLRCRLESLHALDRFFRAENAFSGACRTHFEHRA